MRVKRGEFAIFSRGRDMNSVGLSIAAGLLFAISSVAAAAELVTEYTDQGVLAGQIDVTKKSDCASRNPYAPNSKWKLPHQKQCEDCFDKKVANKRIYYYSEDMKNVSKGQCVLL